MRVRASPRTMRQFQNSLEPLRRPAATRDREGWALIPRRLTRWERLAFLVCAVVALWGGVASGNASAGVLPPTITSDQADYAPGSPVMLSGANWAPGEIVRIDVNDTVGNSWERNVEVTADPLGEITDQ